MDIPELANFTPRASTSTSTSTSFPLDPALASSTSPNNYWDEGLTQSYNYYDQDQDEEEEGQSDEEESDETDAEEEFRQATNASITATTKRTRGGLLHDDGTISFAMSHVQGMGQGKGKERATEGGDEDEQDLGRFINAIRNSSSTGVGGTTALDREFDRSIADELDAFDPEIIDDLSVGIRGKKRRKGQKGGGRRAAADIEPSPEVQRLLFQANELFASGHLDESKTILSEIVRIDPIIRVSWFTLSSIYEEEGDREKSIQCRIVATHLGGSNKDGEDWASLGVESRELGLLHQAIYCFTQAVKANKGDVNSMWDRAYLLKMSGATKMAIRAFQALLELLPHDPGVLRELAPLLASSHLYPQAVQLLLSAFSYYRETVPLINSETVEQLNEYGYEDLETLADFLIEQKRFVECVRVVRQGVRWMQGREMETEWDTVEDDREFDLERRVRSGWEKGNQWLEREPTYDLDVRLRTRLGIARLWMNHGGGGDGVWVEEAKRHFDIVAEEDVRQFPELFDAIGDAYYEKHLYDRALDMFTYLAECDETNQPSVWLRIGQCHAAMGDHEEARECFENVVEEEPLNIEVKVALARVFEQLGEPQKALSLIKEVMKLRRRQEEDDELNPSDRRRRGARTTEEQRKASHRDRLQQEQEKNFEATAAFARLEHLEPLVDQGDEDATYQWLEIATRLVDSFRSTRQLFPSDFKKKFVGMVRNRPRNKRKGKDREADLEYEADEMASRLQRSMIDDKDDEVEETSFRGRDFDEWVNFILQYCFILTKSDELDLAAEVLVHVREASVFRQSRAKEESLRLGLIACFHYAGRFEYVVSEFRWWQLMYPYQTEPIRLLLSLLSTGHNAAVAFNDHKQQKFFTRQMAMLGKITGGRTGKEDDSMDTSQRATSPAVERSSPAATRKRRESSAGGSGNDNDNEDEEDEEEERRLMPGVSTFKPTKLSPVVFTMYGSMLINSQSHQAAIIYLLRAYEIDPSQPLVNLLLATAYIQRSMSRQSDNRQHQIAQGLAFLVQYRKLRGPCQEIDYNFARAFHHLGLQPQAIKHYRNCLAAALPDPPPGQAMDVDSDANAMRDYGTLTKTAAYNLMILLAASGLDDEAREVSDKYLAL